ncbi:hypothetical protein ACVIHH_008294 [Bradyrhizobium sp. USDA 4518]
MIHEGVRAHYRSWYEETVTDLPHVSATTSQQRQALAWVPGFAHRSDVVVRASTL